MQFVVSFLCMEVQSAECTRIHDQCTLSPNATINDYMTVMTTSLNLDQMLCVMELYIKHKYKWTSPLIRHATMWVYEKFRIIGFNAVRQDPKFVEKIVMDAVRPFRSADKLLKNVRHADSKRFGYFMLTEEVTRKVTTQIDLMNRRRQKNILDDVNAYSVPLNLTYKWDTLNDYLTYDYCMLLSGLLLNLLLAICCFLGLKRKVVVRKQLRKNTTTFNEDRIYMRSKSRQF